MAVSSLRDLGLQDHQYPGFVPAGRLLKGHQDGSIKFGSMVVLAMARWPMRELLSAVGFGFFLSS